MPSSLIPSTQLPQLLKWLTENKITWSGDETPRVSVGRRSIELQAVGGYLVFEKQFEPLAVRFVKEQKKHVKIRI